MSFEDPRVKLVNAIGSVECARNSCRALLSAAARPTAIVAMSDVTAIGALHAAKELGLAIPHDIAITGFDDIPEAALITPSLTTIHQPDREKGAEAARVVLDMVNGKAGHHIRLPYQLIVRESA